jgi:hypothetical protein
MWYRGATLKTVKHPERSGTTAVRSTYGNDTMNRPKAIACCSLTILVALYIVGAVSNGSLRHEVQTLPLWAPIVLGFRGQSVVKWAAVPCFIIWFTIMTFIWLFLLGWVRILSGHFSPTEIVLTLIVGAASATGLGVSFRWPTNLTSVPSRQSRPVIHPPQEDMLAAGGKAAIDHADLLLRLP